MLRPTAIKSSCQSWKYGLSTGSKPAAPAHQPVVQFALDRIAPALAAKTWCAQVRADHVAVAGASVPRMSRAQPGRQTQRRMGAAARALDHLDDRLDDGTPV